VATKPGWIKVRSAARGERSDYRLDAEHVGIGGQADVYRAEHKPTGVTVAFKRLRRKHDIDATARMRREIEVGTSLDHANVMPVIDANEGANWLVMPLALDNLETLREEVLRRDELREVVDDICAGLSVAHDRGWIHRDVKPSNVLLMDLPRRWVVADWGLVRRPVGTTSAGGRTRLGTSYGTEGFAPPELSVNAHAATSAADIYYIGQLVGWCLTGTTPLQNMPLLPTDGPWRSVVRAATRHDAHRRPQTVEELQTLIDTAFYRPPDPPEVYGESLVARLNKQPRDQAAADELLELVEQHPDNEELCIDILPQLTRDQLGGAIIRHPERGQAVVEGLRQDRVDWGNRQYRWADNVIIALLAVAAAAADAEELELLEDATDAMFEWDGTWDQWPPQGQIKQWLSGLRGLPAGVVAERLRDHPDAARHFSDVATDKRADRRIRAEIPHDGS
jgi:serine/threonine protein kinase